MRLFALPILFLVLSLLSACGSLMPGKTETPPEDKTYYFDAELGFTIDYPAAWSRQRSRDGAAVRWQGDDIQAVVASRPLGPTTGSYAKMLAVFTLGHPGLVIEEREETDLGGDVPALRLHGAKDDREILAYLIRTDDRAYVLEFSSPADIFAEKKPVFEEMARSFVPL